jgi:hypothetical protein
VTLARATIKFLVGERRNRPAIEVRFNPSEYSIVRNVNYADIGVPGLATPIIQFVRGETQTLSLELFLDASDRLAGPSIGGVTAPTSGSGTAGNTTAGVDPQPRGIGPELADLQAMVTIDSSLHAPPIVEFSWGDLRFQGVVVSFTEKFQLFHEAGYPLRARVTLTLRRYAAPAVQARKLALESPDRTKTRVVAEGERIDVIALEEYGDAAQWPAIARANQLARPRILVPGSVLVIPPL